MKDWIRAVALAAALFGFGASAARADVDASPFGLLGAVGVFLWLRRRNER